MEIPAVYYTKAYTKPPQRKDRGKEKAVRGGLEPPSFT